MMGLQKHYQLLVDSIQNSYFIAVYLLLSKPKVLVMVHKYKIHLLALALKK